MAIINYTIINYTIEYFHSRVKAEIETWPDGIGRLCTDCGAFDGVRTKFTHAALTRYGRRSFRVEATRSGRHRARVLLFRCWAARGDTPRFRKENRRYPEAGIENCTEKDEGGAEWLN